VDPGVHELMMKTHTELEEAGERVLGEALIDPSQAKEVRVHNGAPTATDGPFAEVKESLAAWQVVLAVFSVPRGSLCSAWTWNARGRRWG
jgi:hypothetical protein